MMAVAYEWHNYGKSTIGNRSDIERVPVDNLRAFYKRFYQPDNAVLVVAGKFDEKKALEYITKYFGSLAQARPQAPGDLHRGAAAGRRAHRHAAPGRRRRVGRVALSRTGRLARRVPRGGDPGRHPRFRALGPALQGPGRVQEGHQRFGQAHRRATTRARSRSSPRSTPRTWQPWKRSATSCSRWSTRSPDRASPRRKWIAPGREILKDRELAAADPNRIAIELSEWAAQGDWRLYFLNRDRIEQVTPAQVKEVAEKYFTTSNRTVGFFVPTAKPRADPDPGGARHRQAASTATPAARSRPVRARPPTSRRWPSRPACNGPSRSPASSWPSCPRRRAASRSSCG